MARMHPGTLSPAFTAYSVSAEKAVYAKAECELGDEYHIFHDLKWDDPSIHDSRTRGQIDFVIAHPDYGFIALEVKGGRCSYDGMLRAWTSMDGDDEVNNITDPFDQAAGAARVIRKLLSRQPALSDEFIPHHHAVIFPDCVMDAKTVRADILAWQILDQNSLFNFKHAIRTLFNYAFPSKRISPEIGRRIIKGIADLHGTRNLSGRTATDLQIRRTGDELLKLTNEQLTILRQHRDSKRLIVLGCAGSGKTTLALHKAKIMAEAGKDVLLVCFNQPLAAYLRRECELYPSITVGNFHNLCLDWLDETGVVYTREETDEFYSEKLPDLVFDQMSRITARFDAIIVDEGQDFKETYWVLLELFLREPDEAVFYIFADANQNIYEGNVDYPMPMAPVRLDRNLRNTDQIFNAVKNACKLPDEIESSGVKGPNVRFSVYDDDATMIDKLTQLVSHLVKEGLTPEDITILGTRSQNRTALKYGEKIGPFELVESRSSKNQIRTMTIHRFKGLESPVVILCELDETVQRNFRELMYVGLTRATGLLCVLVRESAVDHYKNLMNL